MEKLFIIDEMLFYIAEYLRIMGYNCIYAKNMKDNDILKLAKEKKAILITGDKELFHRAINKDIVAFFFKPNKKLFKNHMNFLIKELGLRIKEKTRCPKCNSILIKKDRKMLNKNEIKQAKDVIKKFKTFFSCRKCKKIYWRGSHWNAMLENIKEN